MKIWIVAFLNPLHLSTKYCNYLSMQARFELIKVVAYEKGKERFPKDLSPFRNLKDAIAYCRAVSSNPMYSRVVVSCFDNFWDEFVDIEPKDFDYYLSKKE